MLDETMDKEKPDERDRFLNRRAFVSVSALVASIPSLAAAQSLGGNRQMDADGPRPSPGDVYVSGFRINGLHYEISADPRTTLLDLLRDKVGLTGTKKGCDHGQCGACTVLVDGQRVLSCLMFAVMAQGRDITTIEGLAAPDGTLHPMQKAFIDQDAFQCGYCTPGQIVSAVACVKEGHAGSEADIREYMSGNLCRCAAYPNIVSAVLQAKNEMERG